MIFEAGINREQLLANRISAGCVALFALLYALFTKVFPVIAVWEIHEAKEFAIPEAIKRLKSYFPDTVSTTPEQVA